MQTDKTISQLLAEIGVSHRLSKIYGLEVLVTETSVGPVAIDEMDARHASHFIDCARAAA